MSVYFALLTVIGRLFTDSRTGHGEDARLSPDWGTEPDQQIENMVHEKGFVIHLGHAFIV